MRTSFTTLLFGLGVFIVIILLESVWHRQVWLMIVLLVFRSIFMNCSSPIISAVLTNHIDEDVRGK
jgi:hypothetical protein